MLELNKVELRFGRHVVLRNLDLRIMPGERTGIIGASGAGKSTLLKLAAGLLRPSAGHYRNTFRCVRMVFQEPRLLPWRSVAQNIDIALQAAGLAPAEIRVRRDRWLTHVGLTEAAHAWPAELSGGMAQRASIARAFALEPDLLLLDEPFSALDPALRASLSQLCVDHACATGAALLCISHHPHELVRMVDRCLVVGAQQVRSVAIDPDPAARTATADMLNASLLQPCFHSPSII
ncbi:ATP-binding cassette domain-containing protein [Alcaligenaceae bacterium CGII-47]|nr:ATP-binding cassette domain-containing protein [Alcaligenaceae bacterium CGII-47]